MLKTVSSKENRIISLILVLVFMLSIGAMLPVNNSNYSNNTIVKSSNLSNKNPTNINTPLVVGNPTQLNEVASSGVVNVNSNNVVQSLSSTSSIPNPTSYNTTTVYENATNFNVATSTLLPFAERYRINSTLNGWVYPNGLTPNYIPLRKFSYSANVSKGNSVFTNNASLLPKFPYVLRFIPNYPVSDTLSANTTQVNLFIYNSSGIIVAQSTNSSTLNSAIFTPTSENYYYLEARDLSISPSPVANIVFTVQQIVTPKFFTMLMAGDISNSSYFNWYFNAGLTSFGFTTPASLDLDTIAYNRSNTANVDFYNNTLNGAGLSLVNDNNSWTSALPSFLTINSTYGCENNLGNLQMCQSFMSLFVYNSASSSPLSTGMWIPSQEEGHVFGANPQIIKFIGYFGQLNPSLTPNKIVILNSGGKTVLDLSANFTSTSLSSFTKLITVYLPASSLINGSYSLNIYLNTQLLYSYPFSILDSLYGNYHPPIINFGYETDKFHINNNTIIDGTIIYANVTDLDTSVDRVLLSYTTDNKVWSTPTAMTWLDVNDWGFVIPISKVNIANVSLTVFESAPSDQGKIRLQIQTQFLPSTVDLSYNTSTTMQVALIARGGSTTNPTQIKFINDNSFNLVGQTGVTLTTPPGFFVFTYNNNVNINSKFVFNVTISPRYSGLLKITTVAISGSTSESSNVFMNVLGLTTPTVSFNFLTNQDGSLNGLYPYLNSTYPVTIQYTFTGGAPKSFFNIFLVGNGNSLVKTSQAVNITNVYPLITYQQTFNLPVTESYSASSATIYANMTYDSVNSITISKTIIVYPPVAKMQLFDLNGNPLTIIYNNLINKLPIMVQISFYNGTPRNQMTLTISPSGGYFTTKILTINTSEVINGIVSLIVNLDHTNNYAQNAENFNLQLSWDNKVTTQAFNSITIDKTSKFSNFISLGLITQNKLNPNNNNYSIVVNLKSTFAFTLKNIQVIPYSNDGFNIKQNSIVIPQIGPYSDYNLSILIEKPTGFNITQSSYSIGFNITFSGFVQYSGNVAISFSLPTGKSTSISQTLTSNSTSISSNSSPRNTPGFSFEIMIFLFMVIPLIQRKVFSKKP